MHYEYQKKRAAAIIAQVGGTSLFCIFMLNGLIIFGIASFVIMTFVALNMLDTVRTIKQSEPEPNYDQHVPSNHFIEVAYWRIRKLYGEWNANEFLAYIERTGEIPDIHQIHAINYNAIS